MAINLNTPPYYDDFDRTKGFHQILFKPGVAVQARELTQLQSILQNQIKSFGDNVFKNGALITGGDQSFDRQYCAVKLNVSANDSVLGLVDQEIYGTESGMKALVVNATQATDGGDPPTLFVKYLNSGKNKESVGFLANEVIYNQNKSTRVTTAASAVNAIGNAYTITSGIIYNNGDFVYFEDQTAILSKYSKVGSAIVGFDVTESIVTFTEDSSLLDPADGSYNFAAPGADRRTVTLNLTNRPYTTLDIDDPNFIEIARIQAGKVISSKKTTEYNILGDELARRTYDESGDYVVRPYDIKISEHLRTSLSVNDGYYLTTEGGDTNKFIAKISAGKAYVKGYEIDNLKNSIIPMDKARDSAIVTSGSVYVPFGNYVTVTNLSGIPENIQALPIIELRDQFTATPGSSAGSVVGTARIRHIEFLSGDPGTTTAQYNVFLFDIKMNSGYSFTNNVKQFYYNNTTYAGDFTVDVKQTLSLLSGTVSTTNASSALVGSGTRFETQLTVGDYINIAGNTHRITDIIDDFSATISPAASADLAGQTFNIVKSVINDTDKNSYIFNMPVDIVKTIDPTGAATNYSTRRYYERSLTAGIVEVNAGVNETFSSYSTDNYQMYDAAGNAIDLTGAVSASVGNTVLTVDISGQGYSNETVILVATISKNSSAADKKNKTLVTNSAVTFLNEAQAIAQILSLSKADIYRIVSVKMTTAGAFGDPSYNSDSEIDITNRYTLDNGQKATYYGLGSLRLKNNSAAPTAPIKITFDYFTHGAGDYFSVDSYGDIDYKDIPTLILGGTEYVLRDCLDFRPRINDAGTGFSGTGSSVGEFPDFENDIITSYEYYLPRIDKIVLNSEGRIKVVKGKSEYNPQEPKTPTDSMPLYTLKQQPYVFDLSKDIEVIKIDNRRFTMRQIGKLESRIKNLEYYTSLNQLEVDTQNYQIKDIDGLDRFKNGFVVDAFRGHGIGDVYNPDYGCSIDYNKSELRPICATHPLKLKEVAQTRAERISAGYQLTGDLYTLPYTEERFITNNKASKAVNVNPYNIVSFKGIMSGTQSDIWFDERRVPDVYRNEEGNYDIVLAESQAKGTFGCVYGSWETIQFGIEGGTITEKTRSGTEYTVREQISTETRNDVVVSSSVIPKMRDVSINFKASGLMPDTRLYVFFSNINVTADCKMTTNFVDYLDEDNPNLANVYDLYGEVGRMIVSNSEGVCDVTFNYVASKHDLNTGSHILRLSDDPDGNPLFEFTSAQMTFTSSGELRNIANEIVSTRNAVCDIRAIEETSNNTNWYEAGKVADQQCNGFDLQRKFYDGAGGTTDWVTEETNSTICGYSAGSGSTGGGVSVPPDPPKCPDAGTELDTFCDDVTGNLMRIVADGSCGTSTSIKEAGACVPDNPCEPAGTLKRTYCQNGTDPVDIYYDGTFNAVTQTCGTYEQAVTGLTQAQIEAQCPPATVYPTKGTYLGFECNQPGFIKVNYYADGNGGQYEVTEGAGHVDCGYVPITVLQTQIDAGDTTITQAELDLAETYDPNDAPAAGTHIRYGCQGYDYYEYIADGSWGETDSLIEGDSEFYCGKPVLNDVLIYTFHDLDADDDDDGDLDPPRAQIVDSIGIIGGIFNFATGRNMTADEREEATAYLDAVGVTNADFEAALSDGNNIFADGGVDAFSNPTGMNDSAKKVYEVIKVLGNTVTARGIGADSDASITNYMEEIGTGQSGLSAGDILANQAIGALTAVNSNDPRVEGKWGANAIEQLLLKDSLI